MDESERWERADRLFDAALERPRAERTAWLAEQCGGDDALRQQVERLLARADQDDADDLRPGAVQSGRLWEGVAQELEDDPAAHLSPGDRLGGYEIVELLGAGGMGQVYRARDLQLGRDVAIKTLPERVARDPERLRRFEREARLLAALSHPNIAAIYGAEVADERPFLVLELVEGQTLGERLAHGPIDHGEACDLALQMIDALEEAHAKGIVHRDLKPANIKLTPKGRVKVLDFGLAKIAGLPSSTGSDPPAVRGEVGSDGATTRTGTILGTTAYMSPEQARGQHVDRRTDVWAFGCLLYEMLTGRRAFLGNSAPDVLAAVLREEVDWRALPRATPEPLRRLLRRCLRKDLGTRLKDVGDARLEIIDAGDPQAGEPGLGPGAHRWLPLGLAAALALALGARVVTRSSSSPTVTRFAVPLEGRLAGTFRTALALSPDGKQLAYVAEAGDSLQLFLRPLDGFETRALPGTESARDVFWSPDGRWIGFWAGHRLRKVSVDGGSVLTLARANDVDGATWSPDGFIVYSEIRRLYRVPDEGGQPEPLLPEEGPSVLLTRPELLPGGEALLYVRRDADGHSLMALPLPDGQPRELLPGVTFARYVAGHLVYARGGSLFASRFDASRLALHGPQAVLPGGIAIHAGGLAQLSLSHEGALAFAPASVAGVRTLTWIDRQGRTQPVLDDPGLYYMPRVSPDGSRLAVTLSQDEQDDIWLVDRERGTRTRWSFDGLSSAAVWSPDGSRLAYTFGTEAGMEVRVRPVDGSAPARAVASGPVLYPISWSAQAGLMLSRVLTGESEDVYRVDPDAPGELEPVLDSPVHEQAATLSPDGRLLAFASWDDEVSRIYVRPFPGQGQRVQVSDERSGMPVWAPDGRELYFLGGGRFQRLMAASVRAGAEPGVDPPRQLFEHEFGASVGLGLARYDVDRDGERFVFATSETDLDVAQVHVDVGWIDELRRLIRESGPSR